MHKYVWASLIATFVGGALLFWTIKLNVQYKPPLPRGVPSNITTDELEQIKARSKEERNPTPRAASRAVLAESEHDFGTLDPGAGANYMFTIRNEGLESLMLGDPQAMCSCATGEFSRRVIPPGESAELNLAWNVGDETGPFSVGLSLPTSDPRNDPLFFRVYGRVRRQLAAIPDNFAVGDLAADKLSMTYSTLVVSDVWEEFELQGLRCTIAGATCSMQLATREELHTHAAKSGYRISLLLPDDLPTGPFNGKVEFAARPAGGEASFPYSMGVAGNVRGRLSIYGSPINHEGVVDLGSFPRFAGKQTRLLVKVRDADKQLPNARFEIEPAYVSARLVPQGEGSGLYALEIEVPKDAPADVRLRPDQLGTLTFFSDHPRIPQQKLYLRFAITERDAGGLR